MLFAATTRDGILRFAGVVIGYGLLFAGLHTISFSHWVVFNGLRMAALLLLPYRYWPAILLGEAASLTVESMHHVEQNGLAWAFAHAVPGCLFVMPAVILCRKKLIAQQQDVLQVADMLLYALLASLLLTAWNFITLSVTKTLPGFAMPPPEVIAARWAIGNFLGILTLCPMVLATWDVLNRNTANTLAARIVRSGFLMECLGLAAPIAVAAVLYASHVPSEQKLAQVMMIVPVVALALRHGWHGAAAGGFVASTAIIIMMPSLYDHDTLQAETFIAFAMCTMLMLGARITALSSRLAREKKACLAKSGQDFEGSAIGLGLPTPPDAVMFALLAAADAVLERHAQPEPWKVLLATLRECHYRLRNLASADANRLGTTR